MVFLKVNKEMFLLCKHIFYTILSANAITQPQMDYVLTLRYVCTQRGIVYTEYQRTLGCIGSKVLAAVNVIIITTNAGERGTT